MAISSILIYEPIESFRDKEYYWREYADFYEKYWGGPTSPLGVWFGNEYENFRKSLSEHLGMDDGDIEDCYFMKDKEGKYYVAPIRSRSNTAHAENIIPIDWFLLFNEDERKSLYTHWGFNAIHYDTRIETALSRIDLAMQILSGCFEDNDGDKIKTLFGDNLTVLSHSLGDLQTWFSGFDPSGFIVLNYGDICSFIHPSTLKNEKSVEEMWGILHLLNQGKLEEASSAIKVLFQKWEELRAKASGEVSESTLQ